MKEEARLNEIPTESLLTEVCKQDGNSHILEVRNVGDVLEFYLDGKEVFSGDWTNNFLKVFKRAIEMWDGSNHESIVEYV